MSQPTCPTLLVLKNLIEDSQGNDELNNALRYLETFLANRRGYQRKMQIKRKVMTRLMKEHGFADEIDDAVRSLHGDVMGMESLEDNDADA